MAAKKKKIMTARDIERSLKRIALEIVERNHGIDNLAIIGIYTGGVYLAQRLQEIIQAGEDAVVPIGSLDISLYRDDWSLAVQNPVIKKTAIQFPVDDKRIILVDDVLFTGRTIRAALDAIIDFGRPRSIQLAVLIDRGGRELPIQADYVGQEVQVAEDQHVDMRLKDFAGSDEVILSL